MEREIGGRDCDRQEKGEKGVDKAAAKKHYKQTKRPMGVYRIRNTRNDKSYIGFSMDLTARMSRHKAELKFGSHRNAELQGEWNSLGESSFEFEVLDELAHKEVFSGEPVEELRMLAAMWIRKLEDGGCFVVSL
jgi:hypothetical protein